MAAAWGLVHAYVLQIRISSIKFCQVGSFAAAAVAVHSVQRQRVEQVVEPVRCREVDVRVLTQVVTQCRRLSVVVVDLQVARPVQRHQNDQTLLALHHDVVMKCHVELVHAVRAAANNAPSSRAIGTTEISQLFIVAEKCTGTLYKRISLKTYNNNHHHHFTAIIQVNLG